MEKRGLATDGYKADLVNRLQARLDEEEFGLVETSENANKTEDTTAVGEATEETAPPVEEAPKPEASQTTEAVEAPLENKQEPKEENNTSATSSSELPITGIVSTKITDEMTFEEKKLARAKRFKIPVFDKDPKKRIDPEIEAQKRQRAERFGLNKKNEEKSVKKQKTSTTNKDDKKKPLLSKEEIEKRLERAQKYGTGKEEELDELKAMLRAHRFTAGQPEDAQQ